MAKAYKKRSIKSGLPPGSLIHIGKQREKTPEVDIIEYDSINLREEAFDSMDKCFIINDRPVVTWINMEGIGNSDIIRRIGECYGFHPLVLEDIMNTEQRPKAEDYRNYIYIVLKMLLYRDSGIVTEQISLILGSNYVFTFQEGIAGDVFDPVRDRIRKNKGRIRDAKADYLLYSLIDAVIDSYFVILEKMGESIGMLEEEVISYPSPLSARKIQALKHEMRLLRKSIWPLREEISSLLRGNSKLIDESTIIYLRDVYDHTIQLMDSIETQRDILSGIMDIYLSSINNRMNEVIKFLTIIGTIFLPLTFIAGIYGMNFDNMPELRWRYGYFIFLGIMLGISGGLLLFFNKKGWI